MFGGKFDVQGSRVILDLRQRAGPRIVIWLFELTHAMATWLGGQSSSFAISRTALSTVVFWAESSP